MTRRPRRGRARLGASVCLVVAACGTERAANEAAARGSTRAATLPTDSAVATGPDGSSAGAEDGAACGDALRVTILASDTGAGERSATFALMNVGATRCTISGRPIVEARTRGAATEGARAGGLKVTYSPDPAVTVAPGARATFGVSYTGIRVAGRPCVDADSLRVTPPGATRATALPLTMHLCGERVLRVGAVQSSAP